MLDERPSECAEDYDMYEGWLTASTQELALL